MLDTTRFYDAGPCGAGSLEYVDAGRLRSVPLARTELCGTIAGPLTDLSVEQVFRFTARQCDHSIDASYRFPTPGNAVLRQAVVRFGDVTIDAELRPREEAADIRALDVDGQRLNAGKRSLDAPPLTIPGIPPDTDVRITVQYIQVGRPSGIGFSFSIPLARHPMGDPEDPQTRSPPFRDPEHRFTMHVHSIGKGELSSPTFDLQRDGDTYSLKAEAVVPDRDLELMWTPYQYEGRPLLQVFTDGTSEPCFLALVSPPKVCGEGLPREWTIMLDRSVPMEGSKRQAADRAAERLLTSLSPGDRFNLCLFHSTAAWFADRPLKATADNVSRATSFLQDGEPGGLGLEAALEEALGQRATYGDISRHVLIITDAQISNDGRILEMLRRESLKPARRRCSVLCIDPIQRSRPDRRLAEVGGFSCRFLMGSSQGADNAAALDAVLEAWDHPVVANLQLLSSRRLTGLRSVYIDGAYHSEIGELRSGLSTWLVDKCSAGRIDPRFSLPGSDDCAETIVAKGVRALYRIKP